MFFQKNVWINHIYRSTIVSIATDHWLVINLCADSLVRTCSPWRNRKCCIRRVDWKITILLSFFSLYTPWNNILFRCVSPNRNVEHCSNYLINNTTYLTLYKYLMCIEWNRKVLVLSPLKTLNDTINLYGYYLFACEPHWKLLFVVLSQYVTA